MATKSSVPFKLTAGQKLLLDLKYEEKWIERRTRRPFPPEHVLCKSVRGEDDVWQTVVDKDLSDAAVIKLVQQNYLVGRPVDALWDLVRFELTEAGDKECERLRNEEAKHAK